jgi:hypothetical protein
LRDRVGIQAVRIGPVGELVGMPPGAVPSRPPSLRLRYTPGVGVRALLQSAPLGRNEMSLFDVSGRRVARTLIESVAERDWLFPGTEGLPSGLYFARAAIGALRLHARVVVVH